MRTRRGFSYPVVGAPMPTRRKRVKLVNEDFTFFDNLPEDIISLILEKLVSGAECPSDFTMSLLTCKQFNNIGLKSNVLSKASAEVFAVKAHNWSVYFNIFLHRCADAGNIEANYTLGMIQYYCFQNWGYGASLMAKAAIASHAPALYSLAIIQFNGSGVFEHQKDLSAGFTLCKRAASLGHIDAIRELGHCLKDGYGTAKKVRDGHCYLLEANMREIYVMTNPMTSPPTIRSKPVLDHPANRFLASWFSTRIPKPELRVCSFAGCGRPETRMLEFRRCSTCNIMIYCSRGCQARDWTKGHFKICKPEVRFPNILNAGII